MWFITNVRYGILLWFHMSHEGHPRGGNHIDFVYMYDRQIIAFSPSTSDCKILRKHNYINGRFLLLKYKCEEAIYIIVNWYAPRQQFKKDQIDFINFIKSHINKFDNENIIMEGDLNFYINPELDKQKNMITELIDKI